MVRNAFLWKLFFEMTELQEVLLSRPALATAKQLFSCVSHITKAEARRYSRQLILPELGLSGFKKLRSCSVLVIGAGGLGTSACLHLVANGIGTVGIVDYDVIEESNLPRQITYRRSDIGKKKVDVLAEVCHQQNPDDVRLITYHKPFTADVAVDILLDPRILSSSDRRNSWNVVLDCVDNAATRYLLSDLCTAARIPLVSGAALKWEGQLASFLFAGDGPCRRCWWPTDDDEDLNSNLCSGACAEFGVFGPVPGLIGTLQAVEALKICSGMPASFGDGKLLLYDATDSNHAFRIIRMPATKSDACLACACRGDGDAAGDLRSLLMKVLISRQGGRQNLAVASRDAPRIPRLSPQQVVELARSSLNAEEFIPSVIITGVADGGDASSKPVNSALFAIIDVRPSTEVDLCQLPRTLNLPFQQLLYDDQRQTKQKLFDFLNLLADDAEAQTKEKQVDLVVLCRRGNDSQVAYPLLNDMIQAFATESASKLGKVGVKIVGDMTGGLDAWAAQVDRNFPMY